MADNKQKRLAMVTDYVKQNYPRGIDGEKLRDAAQVVVISGVLLVVIAGAVLVAASSPEAIERLFGPATNSNSLHTSGAAISQIGYAP